MKKILLASLLLIFSLATLAQQTMIYTNSKRMFLEGKSLHAQRKFAASTISFQNYLRTAENRQSETIQESKYYIAVNAFELRKDVANHKLRHYLLLFPYTSFYDNVNFMIGTLEHENRNFREASRWFRNVNIERIPSEERNSFHFRYGYTQLQMRRFAESRQLFGQLLGRGTRYENAAIYYYSYSQYALGNFEAALEGFYRVRHIPEFANFVPYYIVQIYFHQQRFEELIPIAQDLVRRNPGNPNNVEIYRILGECFFRKRDYQQAVYYLARWERAAGRVARNDIYLLGIAHFNLQNFEEAVTRLQRVTTERDAISQNAFMHLGIAFLNLDQTNNARLAFSQASRMNFDSNIQEMAAFNYAVATYELGFSPFNETITALEAFLNNFPNSQHREEIYNLLVNVYLTTNNYEAAFRSIQQINNPSPHILEAKQRILFNMGVENYIARRFESAIEHFTNSLTLSRYNAVVAAQARYWRGNSHFQLGQYELARRDYEAFLLSAGARLTNEFNLAHYNIGYTHFNQRNFQQASISFRRFIAMESDRTSRIFVDALNRIGDSYFAQREFNHALRFYSEAAATMLPGTDYSTFQKAFVLGLLRDYHGKIRAMESLLTNFPNSAYAGNAIYEIGQAFIMLEDYGSAIEAYNRLYAKFPTTSMARRGLLQKGMLYFSLNLYDNAINTYKMIIETYPNSEEAMTALESLERVCIQTNQIELFSTFVRSLNMRNLNFTAEREDSLTFVAAERQYILGNYEEAVIHLGAYLQRFSNSIFTNRATHLLANSYLRTGRRSEALVAFSRLTQQEGNPYIEEAVSRAAEISFDKEEYARSLAYFQQLLTISENSESRNIARLGILRSNSLLGDAPRTIIAASDMLEDPRVTIEQTREARYRRALAYISLGNSENALPDLRELLQDPRHVYGAEANFLLANHYFMRYEDELAQQVIFNFIDKHTPHQYWLARCFVLLADIYIRKGDYFQARQYLLSLRESYRRADTIQDMINERLAEIEQREGRDIITNVENQEDEF